ncbi:MAG: HD domain-containing protein [Vampirovibrionia bacterium]
MLQKEYIVSNKSIKATKGGKPFISMNISPVNDTKTLIDAKIWSDSFDKLKDKFKNNDTILILNGKEDSYNNKPQIIINDLKVTSESKWGYTIDEAKDIHYCLLDFIETNITNKEIKEITLGTLNKYSQDSTKFFMAPAAKSHHHNYPGGLLQHTFELCQLSSALEKSKLYPDINWQIVYSACILHDLGKINDYKIENDSIETNDSIKLTGHLVTTPIEIYETARKLGYEKSNLFENLLHAVIAHHGKKEWGSPQEPQTKEAWIVHLVDMLSSRVSGQL